MTTFQKIFLAFSLFMVGCGPQTASLDIHPQTGVIGGQEATRTTNVVTSTVAILVKKKVVWGHYQVLCTGTLITPDTVLTAAHCLESIKEPKHLVVYFGIVLPLTRMENIRDVTQWKVHDGYQILFDKDQSPLTTIHDLAVLKLKTPAPENHQPAKVLANPQFFESHKDLRIAGFGLKNDGFKMPTEALRFVDVTFHKFWETHIIVDQTNTKGACLGDSGGPAYLSIDNELVLAGATRGGHHTSNDCRGLAEYTNVPENIQFILDATKLLSQHPVITVD